MFVLSAWLLLLCFPQLSAKFLRYSARLFSVTWKKELYYSSKPIRLLGFCGALIPCLIDCWRGSLSMLKGPVRYGRSRWKKDALLDWIAPWHRRSQYEANQGTRLGKILPNTVDFFFFIRLIILQDFIRLISYNGPCVRLGCSFFLATALLGCSIVLSQIELVISLRN